jgi:hypothetical protein
MRWLQKSRGANDGREIRASLLAITSAAQLEKLSLSAKCVSSGDPLRLIQPTRQAWSDSIHQQQPAIRLETGMGLSREGGPSKRLRPRLRTRKRESRTDFEI